MMTRYLFRTCLASLLAAMAALLCPFFSPAQSPAPDAALRIQAAYHLAWDHHYGKAIQLFDSLLAAEPGLADARRGLAYSLAWRGNYAEATRQFEEVLRQQPGDWEARKGLAYVALWQRDPAMALRRFEALAGQRPGEAELYQGMSMAHLLAGNQLKAREMLTRLPESARRQQVSAAIQAQPARLEVSVWGGWTRQTAINQLGLRAAQVQWNPHASKAFWVRMDNSLGLDNSALYLRNRQATVWMAGGSWLAEGRLMLKGEAGFRDLPGRGRQALMVMEKTLFFHSQFAWKSGLMLAYGSQAGTDQMLHTGLSWHVGGRWWLEPVFFASWTENGRFDQGRVSISGKYHAESGHEVILGALAGQQLMVPEGSNQTLTGAWLQYQCPMFGRHWMFVNARYETPPAEPFANVSLGFKYRLER